MHYHSTPMTGADAIVAALGRAGVRRLFGMPGGGSTADIMEAAAQAGLPFTLAQTETGSAFMAAAQAEITGAPGVCVATLGPGAASLVNGVGHARLDRVPLAILTDCLPDEIAAFADHQKLPHEAFFGPLTKSSAVARAGNAGTAVADALATAVEGQPGPVHVDISPTVTAAAEHAVTDHVAPRPPVSLRTQWPPAAQQLMRAARRPLMLVGLGARTSAVAEALLAVMTSHGVPALVTYKAKGVVPDAHPWWGGVLTHGALERPLLDQADLFIGVGFDPVELLPRAWTCPQPVVSLSGWPIEQRQVRVAEAVVGDLPHLIADLAAGLESVSEWRQADVAALAAAQRTAMRPPGEPGSLLPHEVVDLVAERYAGARVTVDAGAHMFPVMSLWPARVPNGVLISNGLATMGFALPAAIGAALLDAPRPVVAFTGDGGLLMCLGELKTAAREGVRIRVIVLDDGALSLIRIKQLQRGYSTGGTGLGPVDWCAVGAGLGVASFRADSAAALRAVLADTANHPGPVLIAAAVSPAGYPATIRTLRG